MDTLNFILESTHFDYNQLLHLLKNKCKNQFSIYLNNGIETYRFVLKNYNLYLTPKYLLGIGSLAKFYQDHNFINMNYDQNVEAL